MLYLYKRELALTTTLSTPYNGSFSINYSPAPSSLLQQLGTSDESYEMDSWTFAGGNTCLYSYCLLSLSNEGLPLVINCKLASTSD